MQVRGTGHHFTGSVHPTGEFAIVQIMLHRILVDGSRARLLEEDFRILMMHRTVNGPSIVTEIRSSPKGNKTNVAYR